jgi:hypothetical protein
MREEGGCRRAEMAEENKGGRHKNTGLVRDRQHHPPSAAATSSPQNPSNSSEFQTFGR